MKKYFMSISYIWVIFIIFNLINSCDNKKQIIIKSIQIDSNKKEIKLDTSLYKLQLDAIIYSSHLDSYIKAFQNKNFNLNELKYIFRDGINIPDYFLISKTNDYNYWNDKFVVLGIFKSDYSVKYCVIDEDYNLFLFKGFSNNNFNNFVKQKIGKINNDTLAIKISKFAIFYNSVEYFPIELIDWNNFERYKKEFKQVKLPKIIRHGNNYHI